MIAAPESLSLQDRPELVPGPGEVVVRPAWCGVCGTDLELLHGQVDPAYVSYPLTLGHEWSGVVEAIGDGVEGLAPGTRCVGEGIIPCGRCANCRIGATNICEVYDEIGFSREGAASDQMLLPAGVVHPIGDAVSLVDAALAEPSAVVLTGLEKARPARGARVLVVGDGTIGLLAALFASLLEPSELALAGRRPEQAELARAIGATSFAVSDPPAGAGYDLVIEAAGVPAAFGVAVRAARRGGTVLLLGLSPSGATVELPADLLVNNDLTLVASFGSTSAAWSKVVELLGTGRVAPGRIVTHRFPLEQFTRAFAELAEPTGARGKILLEVQRG